MFNQEVRDNGLMSILFPSTEHQTTAQTHRITTTHTFAGQAPFLGAQQTSKHNSLLNIEVFESSERDLVVKFCGWHPNTMPRPVETINSSV